MNVRRTSSKDFIHTLEKPRHVQGDFHASLCPGVGVRAGLSSYHNNAFGKIFSFAYMKYMDSEAYSFGLLGREIKHTVDNRKKLGCSVIQETVFPPAMKRNAEPKEIAFYIIEKKPHGKSRKLKHVGAESQFLRRLIRGQAKEEKNKSKTTWDAGIDYFLFMSAYKKKQPEAINNKKHPANNKRTEEKKAPPQFSWEYIKNLSNSEQADIHLKNSVYYEESEVVGWYDLSKHVFVFVDYHAFRETAESLGIRRIPHEQKQHRVASRIKECQNELEMRSKIMAPQSITESAEPTAALPEQNKPLNFADAMLPQIR